MEIKKLAPWNWFKKENEDNGNAIPVNYSKGDGSHGYSSQTFNTFNDDMDRLFDHFLNGFGLSPFRPRSKMLEGISGNLLKPKLDLGATDKEYTVNVELPGISEKDISLEVVQDTMIVRGEKKEEKEVKNKNFYRLERSYGTFQRTLSLPEDANRENIKAKFKNGVLNISIPRMEIAGKTAKQIEIKYA